MIPVPKFSIYMPMVNKYNVTKLTLDSLIENIDCDFHNFIIIASGTTEPACLQLLIDIQQKGWGRFSKEKFKIVLLSPTGFSESLNLAISMLDDDEDLFMTPNNNLYAKNFMSPLLQQAYGEKYSEDLWLICGNDIFRDDYPHRSLYETQIRSLFIQGIDCEKGFEAIHSFFQTVFQMSLKDYFQFLITQQTEILKTTLGYLLSAFYIKRECLNTVGFFDERFSRDSFGRPSGNGEERDYVNRIGLCGKTVMSAQQSLFLHIAYGITSRDGVRDQSGIESGEKFMVKWDGDHYTFPKTLKHQLDMCICALRETTEEHYVLFRGNKLSLLHSVLGRK